MNYPHDIQHEHEVIVTALFNKEALYKLIEYGDVFYNAKNKEVFKAMTALYGMNENVDMSSVRAYINSKDYDSYFVDLALVGTVFNYEFILKKLDMMKYQRQLMLYSQDLYKACSAGRMEYQDFINEIIEVNNQINKADISECCTMEEMADLDLDDIFKSSDYISTGLFSLDNRLIGLFNGQLIIIAAGPGMGKSTFAWNLATNINDTLFLSYEMERQELYAKLLARYSGVNSLRIEGKKCGDAEIQKLIPAIDEIKKNIRIKVYDYPLQFFRMISEIRKTCKQREVKAVFIDYLQLIDGAKGENKEDKISVITRTLKLLAKELKKPIVLLSQLTKDVLKDNRKPTLGDLRGSGAIGQDADVVIFLFENKELETQLTIAKGRKGGLGDIDGISFEKNFSRFVDEYAQTEEIKYWNEVESAE